MLARAMLSRFVGASIEIPGSMIEPSCRRKSLSPVAAWRAWLAAVLCTVTLSAAASAQTIPARGGLHEDFARLVIDFAGATTTEISGAGDHLELRFDRAAKIDVAAATDTLKDYIAKASLSPDNRRLILDFRAPVTWAAFNDGAKLALDFAFADDSSQRAFDHGPDAASRRIKAAGAAQPAETASKPAPASVYPASVRLRTGEHPGFSRLAFDWPKAATDYTLRRIGDQVELRFTAPGSIDLGKIAGDLPPRVETLSAAPGAAGLTVKLALKPGMELRDFRSGKTVVLDVYDRDAANLPPQKPQAPPAEMATAQPEPAQTSTPAAQSNAPEPEQELTEVPPEVPSKMPQVAMAPEPDVALQPELQSAMPEAAAPKPKPTAGSGVSGPGVATPVTAQPPTTFVPPRVAPPAVKVDVTALPSKDSPTLYFDWPRRVALAVFRRGDALWLVFDAPAKTDLKQLARVEAQIGKFEIVPSPFSLAIRLTGGANASPLTATEGSRWKITLRPGQAIAPVEPLEQRRETLPSGGTSLYIKAIASGAAVELQDPADRSKLIVVPKQIAGQGIARQSDWPDFKLLPTYQGVVVAPLNDRPQVEASPNGVVIVTPPQAAAEAAPAEATPAPAAATPPAPEAPKPEPEKADAEKPAEAAPDAGPPPPVVVSVPKPLPLAASLFDMKAWRRGGDADDAALKNRVRTASPGDKNRARLDYAEFLLANGFFPEASRQIDDILRDDRNAAKTPLIMAVGAAADTMHGAFDEADRLLAAPALQGVPEANLMAAYIAAKRGDNAAAAKLFSGPLPDISEYPKSFRTDLRKVAARALLDNGDPLTAQNYIDPLKKDKPDAEDEAWATYLDGLRQQKIGQKEAALVTLQKLLDSPVDELKARAQFAVVSAQLDDKKIEPKDAVAKLEALRFLYRGDTFEFDLLTKLGHLYFDVAQPRKGLLTLRQAATHFPDHPKAKQAAADMTVAFRKLYLGGGADKLSPLTAVALYDEFRELTPPGADGDRMIAALADRLVKVDLLDRAGALLDRQVKTRLGGADKVSAGARLAAVRLLDDKPDLALQALGATENPQATSPELQAQRTRLRARALFDTGDTLKGLGLIENDGSLEGLWLKSDMYWKLREWPSAADALGQLIDAEQAKRAAEVKGPAPDDIASNPASVLDKALADAKAAAAADGDQPPADAGPNAPQDPNAAAAQKPVTKPLLDPVLSALVLKRAVALSLANDRRGMKDLGRTYGKQMDTTALAQPFKVLTSPDSLLSDSIAAQQKSVDQLGVFVEEYRKILQSQALSRDTEPRMDTGPLAPLDKPEDKSGSDKPAAAPDQTAGQPTQPAGQ